METVPTPSPTTPNWCQSYKTFFSNLIYIGTISSWKLWLNYFSGLYYKNILTIVSDDHKWCLYYKWSFILVLALASVVNYDCKWRSKL